MKKLSYYQCLTRKTASLARLAGFDVFVSDSLTTLSSYCYIGYRNHRGGLKIISVLRASDHRQPGYFRGGWLSYGLSGKKSYDLRPRSKRVDRERLDKFIRYCKNERNRNQDLCHQSGVVR